MTKSINISKEIYVPFIQEIILGYTMANIEFVLIISIGIAEIRKQVIKY